MNLFENFKVEDLHTPYFLSFKNQLFWEVSFLNETSQKVLIRDGSLSSENGQEIPESVTKNEHQKTTKEVEEIIKRKLVAGYKLRPPSLQQQSLNQKRSVSFQEEELSLKGEHPYKAIHTEKNKVDIKREILEPKEELKQSSRKKSVKETNQGKYFEKREGDKVLFRKVQISGNRLKFEEGYFDKDGGMHCNVANEVECDDEEAARRRMEYYSKGRERSGYKILDEKFEFDFHPGEAAEEIKTEEISQNDEESNEEPEEEEEESLYNSRRRRDRDEDYEDNEESPEKRKRGKKIILSYRPADWSDSKDPKGFYLREKLNGIICIWDGESKFLSLLGHEYKVPEEFRRGFPKIQLVGIMYFGAGESYYVSMCIRSTQMERWKKLKFMVYDAVDMHLPFKERMNTLKKTITEANSCYLKLCDFVECEGRDHFEKELDKAEVSNGEGIFLNDPNGTLISGATGGFYLSKIYTVGEALVVGYGREEGKQGKVKSLRVRSKESGFEFSISRGVEKGVKRHLPKLGSAIWFKTMGEKLKGCPKMPIFVGAVKDKAGVENKENIEEE